MLFNENSLTEKRLEVPEDLIKYHVFSVHSGSGIDIKYKSRFCFRVSVSKNFDFTCDPEEYLNENILMNSYTLQYRNGPQDSSGRTRYYFGDFRVTFKSGKPSTSFENFSEDIKTPFEPGIAVPDYMTNFKNAISQSNNIKKLWEFIIDRAESILESDAGKKFKDIFIHFDLSEVFQVNNWHEMPGSIEVMDAMYLEYAKSNEIFKYHQAGNGYALTRSFLPMVATGDDKNDIQFPDFDLENRYKSFCVDNNKLRCILYHSKMMKELSLPLFRTKPYMFQLIPSGPFTPTDLIDFIDRIKHIKANMFKKKETEIAAELDVAESELKASNTDDIFLGDAVVSMNQILETTSDSITSFDLMLIRDESKTTINISEINNISRSSLLKNLRMIDEKATRIMEKYRLKRKPSLVNAFYDIHQSVKKGEKYQQKYLKFLLVNVRGLYYGDPDLAELFIEHTLKNIRNGDESPNFSLKISYEFIESLNKKGPRMEQEQSAKIGENCASLACPVTFVIKSFLKSEIGSLSRRVQNTESVMLFCTDMMEKLFRHDGEQAGNKLISSEKLNIHVIKIRELLKEMKDNEIKFHPASFKLGFISRFGQERFFATKKEES